jgi:hypothetical protein
MKGKAYTPPKGRCRHRDMSRRRRRAPCSTPCWRFTGSIPPLPRRPIPDHHGHGSAPDHGGDVVALRAVPRRRPPPSLNRTNAGVRRQPPRPATTRPVDRGGHRHTRWQISMKPSPSRGRRPSPPSLRVACVVPTTCSGGGTAGAGWWVAVG